MDLPIKIVIGGLGVRGYEVYASYAKRNPDKMQVTAIAEPNPIRRRDVQRDLGLSDSQCYETMESLLQQPRLGDVAVIATQDRDHVRLALPALEKGYHLLLEKPISPLLQECLALQQAAHRCGRIVTVAHVLRYTQIFSTVKRLLESGEIGRLIHMDLIENVAYWHFAHSYVRGNWRREEDSSPMILAKSCHDLDLLRWFAGSACISLSSNGGLSVFRAESAPEGADDRCTRCALSTRCPYSAVRIYMENEKTGILGGNAGWPCSVLSETPTPDSIRAALEKGPYGRCVYACDNDVADHQCVNMQFANGVCATFTVTAFTQECCRTMRAMGSLGELEIDMLRNRVMLRRFGQPEQIIELDEQKKRIVCSRRAVVKEENEARKAEAWSKLAEGEVVKGIVRRLTDFGAFVDLGGVDGLIHVTDLSWAHVKHPSEVVSPDQEVEVKILSLDKERERIQLGLKQLQPKPWDTAPEK